MLWSWFSMYVVSSVCLFYGVYCWSSFTMFIISRDVVSSIEYILVCSCPIFCLGILGLIFHHIYHLAGRFTRNIFLLPSNKNSEKDRWCVQIEYLTILKLDVVDTTNYWAFLCFSLIGCPDFKMVLQAYCCRMLVWNSSECLCHTLKNVFLK